MAIAAEVAGFEATLRSLDKNPGEPMLEHFFVGCTTGANKVLRVVGLRRAALARACKLYSSSREGVRKLKGHGAGTPSRRAKRTRKLTPERASAMPKPV